MGVNYGTYRCQLRGPRLIGVKPEPNQTGWKHLMAAKERGEKSAKVSIILGQDPYVWIVSGSRVVNRVLNTDPIDELAVAGGLRGKALEVVRSETNDMFIPAHTEMVIEGLATCRSARELALKHQVEMPITEKVYEVLYDEKDPAQAVKELMTRDPKEEDYE